MKKKGIVVSAEGNNAHIRIQRESACGGNCASCASSCAKETVVTAINKAGAAAGDYVELEMESSRVLGAAVLVYVIPLLMLDAGLFYCIFYIKFRVVGNMCGIYTYGCSLCGSSEDR